MDLHFAEQLNGRLWNGAKIAALVCFLIAGVLLAASLFLSPLPGGATRPSASGAVATGTPAAQR